MSRFFRNLLLFSVPLAAALYLLRAQYGTWLIHPKADALFAFFVVLTIITYWVAWRITRNKPDSLMTAWGAATGLRLVLVMGVLVIYLVRGGATDGRNTWTFLGLAFLLYFLYTGFEVWNVVTNLRPFSKPGSPAA